MTKPRIVLIDDEPDKIQIYLDALEPVFEVTYYEDPNDGLHFLTNVDSLGTEALVLDILMPSLDDTVIRIPNQEGDTGLALLASVADRVNQFKIAIVIITNRNVSEIKEKIKNIPLPSEVSNRVSVHLKLKTTPDELVTIVNDSIRKLR
ncbi:MAG: hypothetical protein HY286_19450 [Planctomycetes bacterium]|nr:hypothetical protein [Planctomycetota bacterium]